MMEIDNMQEQSSEDSEELDHDYVPDIVVPVLYKPAYSRVKDFHKTTDRCLQFTREAIFEKQWERAAVFLTSYIQTLSGSNNSKQMKCREILWRLGSEILLHHPKSKPDDIYIFHETMKNIGVKHYLPISLEQVFYCLCNGQTDEAYRILTVAGSWRFGKLSMSQEKLQKLIQAFRAVLDYHSWLRDRTMVPQSDVDYFIQSFAMQEMSSYFRQASVSFQEILRFPGVWDSFVLCYVDMLETSGNKREAENVLTEYAYSHKNPPNPNAHVYLYEFMKRNEASDDMLIKVLTILHNVVPSHKLMLEFSKLLKKSGSDENLQLALQVLFELLDFSGWKEDLKAWRYLVKHLKKSLKCDHRDWVLEAWHSRSDWWPSYHFTKLHARMDWHKCSELALKKASVAGVLQGPDCRYVTLVFKRGRDETAITDLKEFLNKYDCRDPDPEPEPDAEEPGSTL